MLYHKLETGLRSEELEELAFLVIETSSDYTPDIIKNKHNCAIIIESLSQYTDNRERLYFLLAGIINID